MFHYFWDILHELDYLLFCCSPACCFPVKLLEERKEVSICYGSTLFECLCLRGTFPKGLIARFLAIFRLCYFFNSEEEFKRIDIQLFKCPYAPGTFSKALDDLLFC